MESIGDETDTTRAHTIELLHSLFQGPAPAEEFDRETKRTVFYTNSSEAQRREELDDELRLCIKALRNLTARLDFAREPVHVPAPPAPPDQERQATPPQITPTAAPPQPTPTRSDAPPILAILTFFLLLVGTAGLILFHQERIDRLTGATAALFYLIAALLPAILLFGLFRNVARLKGKLFGIPVELGGPAALFIIILLFLINVAPPTPGPKHEPAPTDTDRTTTTSDGTTTTPAKPTPKRRPTGSLQLHYLSVGQGMSALLVTPSGETMLFDNGDFKECDKPITYLKGLGLTGIDYHVASHYHADHIGCAEKIFDEFPLRKAAYDGGGSYTSRIFERYVAAVGGLRKAAAAGDTLILDQDTTSPVFVKFVALNGDGKSTAENALSLVTKVSFEDFDAIFGGDLQGFERGPENDIETSVAPLVGQVEVYSVHHHCSNGSSNPFWLATTKPRVGIISVGDENKFRLPTPACLARLHAADVRTYWTATGSGASPTPGRDTVAGTVIISVTPGAHTFTVKGTLPGVPETRFPTWEAARPSGRRDRN